ncbi:hypothetical protein [Elioraea sp.]|uniref:hypothetical protein n=1 Tax=Elioraea sp. TaxID=2185103 RepID=UPI0025C30935|nr:hypothetical protein [Elioraea sp.]
MDTFDQRRTFSLVLGIAALGFAFAVAHVDEQRRAGEPVPAATSAASQARG